MTVVRRPPPQRTPRPLFCTLPAGTAFVRIYNPASHGTTALTFRTFGPFARFDHQKRHNRLPADNPGRGIYYGGLTLSCCVVEVFGEIGVIECADYHAARPHLVRPVRLLDLRGNGAMRAGSLAALCSVPSRPLSQAWSRYFYDTACYRKADGIIYPNAHNGEISIALYERAQDAVQCSEADTIRLDAPALRPHLLDIANRANLIGPL